MTAPDRCLPVKDPDALRAFVLADPLCRRLALHAEALGRPLALVGGWVRDWLLDRSSPDWDLVVPGDPRPLIRALIAEEGGGVLVPLDEDFGIYRTRLRSGLLLDFAQATGDSVLSDLGRRDLTINAMAVDLRDGALLDPTGGLADLRAGIVRTPTAANLADDPLRMVRVFRFAGCLGFEVDAGTRAAVASLAPQLARSAGERVLAELAKLLTCERAGDQLAAMAETGLLAAALGELPPGGLARARWLDGQLARFHTVAWRRLAMWLAEEAGGDRPRHAALMLAALLRGAEPAALKAAAARLRWSRKEDTLITAWARDGARFTELVEAGWDARAIHRFLKATGEAAPGLAALGAEADPAVAEVVLEAYFARLSAPLPRLLDGYDLMTHLGLPPGRAVAALLAEIEEAQALGELATREEALAWAARKGSPRE